MVDTVMDGERSYTRITSRALRNDCLEYFYDGYQKPVSRATSLEGWMILAHASCSSWDRVYCLGIWADAKNRAWQNNRKEQRIVSGSIRSRWMYGYGKMEPVQTHLSCWTTTFSSSAESCGAVKEGKRTGEGRCSMKRFYTAALHTRARSSI